MEGQSDPLNTADRFSRAASTSTFSDVFDNLANAILIETLSEVEDTTRGWVAQRDVRDFREKELLQAETGETLDRRHRGGHASAAGAMGTRVAGRLRVYDFARTYHVDRQDVVDDRLGAIETAIRTLVDAALRTRLDLLYYILLSNPNTEDGNALFGVNHSNTVGSPLSTSALSDAMQSMRMQQIQGRNAGIVPRYLITCPSLEQTARETIKAIQLENESAPLQLVVEPRLEEGVTDPVSGNTASGSTTSWFLAAANGRGGLTMGSVSGEGGPELRNFPRMGEYGFYGQAWAIRQPMGAAAQGWRGLVRGNS
jgi:hypothetical protein